MCKKSHYVVPIKETTTPTLASPSPQTQPSVGLIHTVVYIYATFID